jgi:glucuronate isomerase
MDINTLSRDIETSLETVPTLDAHTHLDATHLAARGLHDILLYHMVVSDLVSAGCPDAARMSENPTDDEARTRIERALPYLPAISNTSCSWGVRIILEHLFDWRQPVTAANWRKLDGIVRERAKAAGRPRELQSRAGIVRSCTELWRRHDGRADDMLQYSLEWAFFARAQWGENDTAVYELEKAWSEEKPSAPSPVTATGARPVPSRRIRSVADVRDALDAYVQAIPSNVLSTAQHISTDIDFRPVDERTMAAALRRRGRAGREERDVYASFILEEFFKRWEKTRGSMAFQFSLGAEPLPFETASRLSQKTLASLGEMIARHPGVRFQCYLSSAHANQTLCTLARELPNFSLAGYWWHNFFPAFIERVIAERLDMLSTARQVGFFSDAYTMEWSYAKAILVRRILSRVLAGKVVAGQYDKKGALTIAREILFDTPRDLLGLQPAVTPVRGTSRTGARTARRSRAAQ